MKEKIRSQAPHFPSDTLSWLLTVWLFLASLCAEGQTLSQKKLHEFASALAKSQNDTNRVGILLALGRHHLHKRGEEKRDLDSSSYYLNSAAALSKSLAYHKGIAATYFLGAQNYRERGDTHKGKELALQAIDYSKRFKLNNECGESFEELASYYSANEKDKQIAEKRKCWEQALTFYGYAGNKQKQAYALEKIAGLYHVENQYQTAIPLLKQALMLYNESKDPALQGVYILLSDCYHQAADFEPALRYGLAAIRLIEKSPEITEQLMDIYGSVALTSFFLNQRDLANEFSLKAIAAAKYLKDTLSLYYHVKTHVQRLLYVGRTQDALDFLKSIEANYTPPNRVMKLSMDANLFKIYAASGRLEEAKAYYLSIKNGGEDNRFSNGEYEAIIKYLIKTGQYKEGDSWLQVFDKYVKDNKLDSILAGNVSFYRYKLDSCRGDYATALKSYTEYHRFNVSRYADRENKLVQSLRVEFETEKKDKQLKIQDQELRLKEKNLLLNRQDILLLTRQSELQAKDFERTRDKLLFQAKVKEKDLLLVNAEAARKGKDLLLQQRNIDILKKEGLLRQANLDRANATKNVTAGGIAVLAVIMLLLYKQYRQKQNANILINKKNEKLESLVEEKEWLVKEIHHRVKNNLQTIVSLLESQTVYLETDDALMAIKDSQNRVYTMSLLHQKLYQSDNLGAIKMNSYVAELVSYLRDSFDLKQRITFCLEIAPIELDVSQAIPLGLIINEAVTNCIKHAFPNPGNHQIIITIEQDKKQHVNLVIRDNGVGFADSHDPGTLNSLGLKLIAGLSDDIGADLKIMSDQGTEVQVSFEANIMSEKIKQKILTHETAARR